MRERTNVLVLTDHMPWGHRTIAKAIYSYLVSRKDPKLKLDYFEAKTKIPASEIYEIMYRFAPSANSLLSKHFASTKLAHWMAQRANEKSAPSLLPYLTKTNPEIIISTYFLLSHLLIKLRRRYGLPYQVWTLVADPWGTNRLSYVKGADLTLVYDETAKKQAIAAGIDPAKIISTGWWVKPEMYEKHDIKAGKKKLGINNLFPTVFVGGGSLGSTTLTKIIPSLITTSADVNVIFNCGSDKITHNIIRQFTKLLSYLGKNNHVVIKNLRWIDNMAEILAVSDLVLGKAGPNFLFECVAAGKPFVAIMHMGGQEDGNIEIIRRKKLGWVREKNSQAAKFLSTYLQNPAKFNQTYAKNIKSEANYNKQSLPKIYSLLSSSSRDLSLRTK